MSSKGATGEALVKEPASTTEQATKVKLPTQWPPDVEIRRYVGGCHCRKFVFEFEHPNIYESEVVSCNCSICKIKGGLLA